MNEEIAQLLEDTANMLRGMTLDPAIPAHAKDAMRSRIVKLETVAETLTEAAAPVPELAESDRHVLIHALTGSGDGHVYRNYYNALSGHASMPSIKRLIAAGLMKEGSPGYFHCTEAGAKAVGLHLPNDSRDAAPVPAGNPAWEWIATARKGADK